MHTVFRNIVLATILGVVVSVPSMLDAIAQFESNHHAAMTALVATGPFGPFSYALVRLWPFLSPATWFSFTFLASLIFMYFFVESPDKSGSYIVKRESPIATDEWRTFLLKMQATPGFTVDLANLSCLFNDSASATQTSDGIVVISQGKTGSLTLAKAIARSCGGYVQSIERGA